ncbi:MAG: ABC transporter permease [Betaproteobacteria bacterium]
MASAAPVIVAPPPTRASTARRVALVRLAIVVIVLSGWEVLSMSGWLYRDVVPSLQAIGKALATLATRADFYSNLGVTVMEIAVAVVIGGLCGLAVGIALGANRFLSNAFEALLLYLGPTPKIIFLPVMLMWFGVGSGSKIAMGVVSCFFPVAISAAAGMRQIDAVLIRVGRSFRATTWKMVTSIYLPAMRQPVVNGFRLGLGVAIIGTLLAETKLSNKGLGYLIIQAYATFDMPSMYALLIVLFVLSIGVNALIGRLGRDGRRVSA